MKNIYPKLAVPLLFAFSACATNQTKKPTVPESGIVTNTLPTTTDTGSHKSEITTAKAGNSTVQAKQSAAKGVVVAGKPSVAKNALPDLPAPPHFENEEVNKGVQEFDAMLRENMVAEQNHDTARMKELKTRMSSLPTNIAIWIFNMSADERESFKAYLEKVEKVAKANTDSQ